MKYLKVYLISSICCGLPIGLYYYFKYLELRVFLYGLLSGPVVAILFTLAFWSLSASFKKKDFHLGVVNNQITIVAEDKERNEES